MKDVHIISSRIYDLKGIGEEWLLSKDGGHIVAVFKNGVMQGSILTDEDDTLVLEGDNHV